MLFRFKFHINMYANITVLSYRSFRISLHSHEKKSSSFNDFLFSISIQIHRSIYHHKLIDIGTELSPLYLSYCMHFSYHISNGKLRSMQSICMDDALSLNKSDCIKCIICMIGGSVNLRIRFQECLVIYKVPKAVPFYLLNA